MASRFRRWLGRRAGQRRNAFLILWLSSLGRLGSHYLRLEATIS